MSHSTSVKAQAKRRSSDANYLSTSPSAGPRPRKARRQRTNSSLPLNQPLSRQRRSQGVRQTDPLIEAQFLRALSRDDGIQCAKFGQQLPEHLATLTEPEPHDLVER